ncbi:hypothetical protein DMH04_40095 [Kibdelosporangium aridum]|uniref:Uncharacterized protein n=1 Tax=Kibdelosporangium aridum TaxID=2030 RepID=A0A428YWI1_KIBAR|nr:hypothetical protein [Kibdelosporangium aridum]RSM74347.1 hypothetical protein DMH04_40095 [Kibdelosporangium aridum]
MTDNTPDAQQPDEQPALPPLTITPPQNTAAPSDTAWQPLPGDQFPAAVLPQSPYVTTDPQTPSQGAPVQHPSGPLPTVAYPAPAPRKPRNKPAIVMTVLAIVFFLASGAFGALWLVEQGDHKGTNSELQTVRSNLSKTTKQLEDTERERAGAVSDKQRAEQNSAATKPCLDAAKGTIRSISEDEFRKNFQEMVKQC